MTLFTYTRRVVRACIIAAACFILPVSSLSDVSLRNGNYFTQVKDIELPGGLEPRIRRVYNSLRHDQRGIFGYGWLSDYETLLKAAVDGSVIVYSVSDSVNNDFLDIFRPDRPMDQDIAASVDMLARVALDTGQLSHVSEQSYKEDLQRSQSLRREQWEKFSRLSLMPERRVSIGAFFERTACWCYSYQSVARTRDGFLLNTGEGATKLQYIFDEGGRLVRVSNTNGKFLRFSHSDSGEWIKVLDDADRLLTIVFNSRGLVDRIEASNGLKVEYRYDNRDDLVYCKTAKGDEIEYAYDNNHLLTRVKNLTNNETETISYLDKDPDLKVRSVKSGSTEDARTTFYEYKVLEKKPDLLRFIASTRSAETDPPENSTEFTVRYDQMGHEWVEKKVKREGDAVTVTEHNSLGNPVSITANGKLIKTNTYNEHGQVMGQETESQTLRFKYDERSKKISYAEKIPKSEGAKPFWEKFEYDVTGNLLSITNSEHQQMTLEYDTSGRIVTLMDDNGSKAAFVYNNDSKPIKISIDGPKVKGSMSVTYTKESEIEKVDSTEGHAVAAEVTRLFQKLLELINIAKVEIY